MFSTGSARIGLDKLAAGAETSAAIFLKIKTMELVSVKSLNVAFGAKTVFDGLDWSVSKGENWAISGESGSGKTCLLKALAGKIEHGGTVEINFAETSAPKEALYVENWYKFVNLEGDRNFYYQQRYNYHAEHDTLTVFAELEKFGGERGLDIAKLEPILAGFGFEQLFLLAVDRHGARRGLHFARDQAQQRRLARAVAADQTDTVLRIDQKGDVIEEGPAPVAYGKVIE